MIFVILTLVASSVVLQLIAERRRSAIARAVGIGLGVVGVAMAFTVDPPTNTRLVTGILAVALVLHLVTRRSRRNSTRSG